MRTSAQRIVVALVGALAGCGFELDLAPSSNPIVDAPPEAITMCAANQPLCIGRMRVVCNATGTGIDDTLSSICPLACLEGGQCVAASNIPDEAQRACRASAPALAPPSNATIQFRPGGSPGGVDIRCTPSCGNGTSTITSSRVVQASGPPIAMFCLRSVDIPASASVTADPAVTNAIALLVVGNVQIAGTVALSGTGATRTAAGQAGPAGGDGAGPSGDDASGSSGGPPCGGGGGTTVGTNASAAGGGGGGGGHAARGGDGGQGRADTNLASGGPGGNACGTDVIAPLAGGGGGGAGGDGSCHPTECGWAGGGGGGAIQISATGSLAVTGAIRVAGGAGFGSTAGEAGEGGGGGGGAGGAILLEAPTLALGGALDVSGGTGGASNAGPGGGGGIVTLAGGAGAVQNAAREGGGGGGGAAGRIRINGATAVTCGAAAQPAQACTAGTLRAVP